MRLSGTLKLCEERSRLLDLLNRAAQAYAEAVNSLCPELHNVNDPAYLHNRYAVAIARRDTLYLADQLEAHRAEHGC